MSDLASACTAWSEGLAQDRPGWRRRIGTWLLAAGCTGMLMAMFATPPWASIGAGCALAGALLTRAPLQRMPWLWIGLAYCAWIAASGAIAWMQGIEGGRWRPAAAAWTWIATPLVAIGLADPRTRRWAMHGLLVLGLASLAVALAQFVIGLGDGPLRIDPTGLHWKLARGLSEHHLTYGLAGALLLACSLPDRAALGTGRAGTWAARTVGVIGVVISGSRAAALAAAAGVWASLTVRGRRWALIGVAAIVVAGIAFAARFAITEPGRFARSLRFEDGRWPIWNTSLHLVAERPLVGWGGKDAFKAAYREAFPTVNPGAISEFPAGAPHAHSSGLALMAEYGIPALLLHAALWGSAMIWLWRRRYAAPAGWQAGVAVAGTAVIGGLFEPYATRAVQGIAIHAALGLSLALSLSPAPSGGPCSSPTSR